VKSAIVVEHCGWANTMRGTVKWFDDAKGYGFIKGFDGLDVFCHFAAIQASGRKTLRQGDEVEFEIVEGPKGPQAARVFKV
jgi:CspA family cold shock protein